MKEWSMPPTPSRAKAGAVTFVVRNAGKLEHEFVILRTNKPANALPVRGGRAVETGRVARLPHIRRGQTKRLTVTLRAGRYVLLCNLPAHYKAGQRAAFRVT
jgi:uncharacterized cupredoxin-like copper-binding protein